LIRLLGSSVNLVQGCIFVPLEAFSTDFTELLYAQGQRKAQLMVLLDITSDWAGGWASDSGFSHAIADGLFLTTRTGKALWTASQYVSGS